MDFIRQVITARKAEPAYLEQFTKNYQNKLIDANTGRRALTLNDFIDLMTALRCEVIVVPLAGRATAWYRLNDFPDRDGNVLKIPDKIEKDEIERHRDPERLRGMKNRRIITEKDYKK